jgi:hypothetical protein
MFYCGLLDSKPQLALDFEPKWFDRQFQINLGNKEIISSAGKYGKERDKWVENSEMFKTITGYSLSNSQLSFYFSALDWDDEERYFVVTKCDSNIDNCIYRVQLSDIQTHEQEWVKVNTFSCKYGKNKALNYVFALLILLSNILLIFAFARSEKT